jgi:hypothetical protein
LLLEALENVSLLYKRKLNADYKNLFDVVGR